MDIIMKASPKNNFDHSTNQYQEIFEGQAKKIDCVHEIVFNINASIYSSTENPGQDECKGIYTRNYHIPVKDNTDTNEFIRIFFAFLEKCLSQSAEHSYLNTPDGKQNNE